MTKNRKKMISKVIASGMLISNIPIQTFANEIEDVIIDTSNIEENISNEEINKSEILDIDDKTEIIDSNELENEDTISEDNNLSNPQLTEENIKIEDTISLDTEYIKKSTTTKAVVDNTYIINSLDDLKQLRTEINTNNLDTTGVIVELSADIDFASETNWESIGTTKNGFKGVFNGNGYALKNLNLNGVNFEGIFSNTGESTFKNVNINNFSIVNSGTTFVGTLVGISNANINFESITISNIQIDSSNSNYSIGGLIGFNPNGKITNFTDIQAKSVAINGNNTQYVGGLVGQGTVNFKNIEASVEILSSGNNTGGLMGSDGSGTTKPLELENININLKLKGSITGGLIGSCTSNNLNIENVLISGESIEGSGKVGGLIGNLSTSKDVNIDSVQINLNSIKSNSSVGGLIGYSSTFSNVNFNNIELNNMILEGKGEVGGLIGSCQSSGNIVADSISMKKNNINSSASYSGGLIGYNSGAKLLFSNLELDNEILGVNSTGGVVGESIGEIDIINSDVNGKITSTDNIGGLIGSVQTRFEASGNNVNIYINGNNYCAGIVGKATSSLNENVLSENNVKIIIENGKNNIGGLIGSCTGKVTISKNLIDCNLTGEKIVSGVIGYASNIIINNNKVNGTISGNEKVGGLIAETYNINNSIYENDIRANIVGKNYVGGIAGFSFGINMENNLILNRIEGETNVGGICGAVPGGNSDTSIKSSVIASQIISTNPNIVFGNYGSTGSLSVENLYYDTNLTAIEDNLAVGLTTEQMQGKESLNNMNLNFESIWKSNKEFYPTFEQLNSAPDIIPNDKVVNSTITINQYDKFDISKYITIEDFEGDEITISIKSTKETLDTSKYGTFPITVIATDAKGLSSELSLNVKINPLMIKVNEAPVIVAEDITLTVGDEFNPSKMIIAVDEEDGIITDSIKIIENTVDINKAGAYKVTYEVTDKDGAKTTKTITVTVKAKEVISNDNNSNNNGANTTDKDTDTGTDTTITEKPQTGDNIFVAIMSILMSVAGLYSINRRREK